MAIYRQVIDQRVPVRISRGDFSTVTQAASRFAIIPASVFPRNAGSNCDEMGFARGARALCPPKGHPQ
jgi:hypothetical protein